MDNKYDLFKEILENEPSSGTFFLILSKMKEEGRFREIIQECLKALKIYPNDIHIRQLLADAYLEEGQLSQAERELELITAGIDDLAISYKLLADVYVKQGRNEDAIDILDIYLKHKPGDIEAFQLLESLRPSMESPDEQPLPATEQFTIPEEEIFEEAVFEQEQKEAMPEETLSEAEPEEGYIEEVFPEQEEEELPEIATPTLAELYFDQGHLSDAIVTYEKIIEQNPDDESSMARLEELKAMITKEEGPAIDMIDPVRQRKEKIISTLESWLSAIQADSKTGVTPN